MFDPFTSHVFHREQRRLRKLNRRGQYRFTPSELVVLAFASVTGLVAVTVCVYVFQSLAS